MYLPPVRPKANFRASSTLRFYRRSDKSDRSGSLSISGEPNPGPKRAMEKTIYRFSTHGCTIVARIGHYYGPQPFAAVRRRNQSLQSFSARPTDLVELTRTMRCNTDAIAACRGWPIVDASLCVDLHTWGKHGRLIPYRQFHRDSSSATIPHDGIPKREPSDANSVPEQFRVGDVPQEPH